MKYLYSILFIIMFAAFAQAQVDRTKIPKAGPAPEIQIGEYELFTLDNGLKVIIVESHKLPRISFSLSLDYEPIFEGDKVGYTSIAGQLLNTGTTHRTKAELDEEIDFIGASLSASASGIFGSSLTKHKDELLELMTDMLYNPSFPEEELDKIKKQTISGLAAYKENANQIASSVANVVRYGKDHPYGEITRVETIDPITIDDCREFYNTYFKPNIAYLTIVGDISPKQAKPLVNKYFSEWESGEVPENTYKTPQKPDKTQVVFVDRPQSVQSVIAVTYPVELKPGSPDGIQARVMNTILGGGFSSNLNQNLREEHAYTYGSGSSLSSDRLIGRFSASASVRNEVTDSAVAEILHELTSLKENVVSEEQLQSIKNYITGGFARALESPETVARFALNIERYNLPKDYYANYLKKLQEVTVEDIQNSAQKYLSPDHAYILVVGKKDDVAESLEKFSDINYLDIYGDPVKEFETEMDPANVIRSYLEKIGGEDRLQEITSMRVLAEAKLQGMTIQIESRKAVPSRWVSSVSIEGGVVQKRIYDNGEVMVIERGAKVPVSDMDKMYMKNASKIFPELDYSDEGFDLSIVGMQKIGDEEAFEVKVVYPDGTEVHNYYGVESKLKLRTESANEGEVTYLDFREKEGILFPFKTSVSTPQGALDAIMLEIELNEPMDDSVFK